MDKILAVIAIGLGAIALVFGLSVLLAFPTMWLVNFLTGLLFGKFGSTSKK